MKKPNLFSFLFLYSRQYASKFAWYFINSLHKLTDRRFKGGDNLANASSRVGNAATVSNFSGPSRPLPIDNAVTFNLSFCSNSLKDALRHLLHPVKIRKLTDLPVHHPTVNLLSANARFANVLRITRR